MSETISLKVPSKSGDVYKLLHDVSDITKKWFIVHQSLKDNRMLHCYETLVASRNFDGCYDYGQGFLCMWVRTSLPEFGNLAMFETQIYMASIDDSAWRACSQPTSSLDEANVLTDKVYEFMKSSYGNSLYCTEQQLNIDLREFGMFGQSE